MNPQKKRTADAVAAEKWSSIARRLIEEDGFSPAQVRQAGIEILGFPSDTFDWNYEEIRRFLEHLQKSSPQN